MTLQELGERHGTDKAAHGYLPFYEKHLPEVVTSVLEIGVLNGNSLRMWADYFPAAHIYGVDIDPRCRQHESDRIDITICSQDDAEALTRLAERAGGFDVVIDDGSHVNVLTLASFETLWPYTRGAYVIEDLSNSYIDLTPHVVGWPGMKHNRDVDYRNHRGLVERVFLDQITRVDERREGSVHFYPDLAVFCR